MSWKLKERIKAQLGREQGAVVRDWGSGTSVALLYPNSYRIGMGNLAVHSIYSRLNAAPGIVCERAFMPDQRELKEYGRSGSPIFSMESQRPLADFDCIAITASFENDYLNIIPMLDMCRIPHRSHGRRAGMPVIIAGGAAPTLNPMPLSAIVDAVVRGDFEAYEEDLIDIIKSHRSRDETISRLAALTGAPRHAMDIDSFKTETAIYASDAEFGDMHLIEVERGCPRKCLFCATPAIYGRHRFRSAASVLSMVSDGLAHRKKFGLIGADILSHPDFISIAREIHSRGATFSPSSVRADAIDDERAALLAVSGHKSIALGVEAGSESLRRKLGKGITDDSIMSAASALAHAGITKLRLYFMVGLPDETEEDIAAIPDIARRVKSRIDEDAPREQRITAVDLTVTPFIPKPGTPFSKDAFAGRDALKKKFKSLKRMLGNEKGISLRTDSIIDAELEYRLANGDESTVEFLEQAARSGSARAALD